MNELEIGKIYQIRLAAGHWTNGRYLGPREYQTHRSPRDYYQVYSRAKTHYLFLNLATGREIEIKSKARINNSL